MSRPIYEPNLERTDAALGYDKNQLQRRPSPVREEGMSGDRAVEYVLGGNYWRWLIFGQEGVQNNWAPVQDLTLSFGGYFETTTQDAAFIMGMPLGPKWSNWSLDLVKSRGPDYGNLDFDWATSPFRREDTPGWDGYDIVRPAFPNEPTWYELHSGQVSSGYSAAPIAEDVDRQLGRTMRIVGNYGDMLTAAGVVGPGLNQREFNGGDGVMWWLRGKVKTAGAEGGFRFRLHWLRITRTYEDQGYPI